MGTKIILALVTLTLLSVTFVVLDFVFNFPFWILAISTSVAVLILFEATKHIYIIPEGKYGLLGNRILQPGEYFLWEQPLTYTPAEVITTIGTKIIVWDLDPNNLVTYDRAGGGEHVEPKLRELLNANPAIDLKDFEKQLGIKVIRQSGKVEEDKKEVRISKDVNLIYENRTKHILIIGKTGTGKSTLMLNMIRQDMEFGKGVAVVEPGDLVRDLLRHIPESRHKDVLYYDFDHPIPIDVFETRGEEERETLAEDIITTFRRFFESSQWGMGMDTVLRFTVLALAQYPKSTFLDIYKFLADESFRAQVLSSNSNPTISHFWAKEFPKNPTFKTSVTGINSRMAKFVTSSVLQNTLGTKIGAIDFQDVVQNKKILLVNLRGGEAGSVIGSLIVSKIQQTAMRRRENRIPFYLYADEFQNYTTSAFNVIFTEARKYELGMTLATQLLSNVPTNIRDNILQAGTAIVFRSDEGNVFRNRLGDFEPKDVATLAPYHSILMGTNLIREIETLSPPLPTSPPFKPRRAEKPTQPKEGSVPPTFDDELHSEAE